MAMSDAHSRWWGAICGVVAVTSVLSFPARAAELAWPSQVSAHYKLEFNGFDVGVYDFLSRFDGKSYTATAKTEISALFGAFKWTGNFSGSGTIDGAGPRPAIFQMSYKTGSKFNSIKMGFDATGVSSVTVVPNKPPRNDAVRVTPNDLKSVFDPIAATLQMSNTTAAGACNRSIPVFDGKARFDLRLSYKGREAIKDKRPTGQPAELVVCSVKYIPVAGHRPKDFVNPWIDYDHIEIALRAVPTAGIYVPYRVTVPSTVGPAVMSAEAINITAANNTQIALRQ